MSILSSEVIESVVKLKNNSVHSLKENEKETLFKMLIYPLTNNFELYKLLLTIFIVAESDHVHVIEKKKEIIMGFMDSVEKLIDAFKKEGDSIISMKNEMILQYLPLGEDEGIKISLSAFDDNIFYKNSIESYHNEVSKRYNYKGIQAIIANKATTSQLEMDAGNASRIKKDFLGGDLEESRRFQESLKEETAETASLSLERMIGRENDLFGPSEVEWFESAALQAFQANGIDESIKMIKEHFEEQLKGLQAKRGGKN